MIAEPRLATTICVLAPVDGALRVLMVRRSPAMRFMPGAWVFPGGVIDRADAEQAETVVPGAGPDHRAWVVAGIREVFEETGIWLSRPPMLIPAPDRPSGGDVYRLAEVHGPVDGAAVHHLSTWITPTMVPVRFHTRFLVTALDQPVDGDPDGIEVDDLGWVDPAETIAAADAGDLALPLPTLRTLAGFATLGSIDAVLDGARTGPPPVIRPRLRLDTGVMVALLPGDDGYDETPDLPPDPLALGQVVEVRSADGRPVPELGLPR